MSRSKITDASVEIIESWRDENPVAVLMGEFSAGKSTLLNFILGTDVALTQVTATALPPIWFTYSRKPFVKGLKHDGTFETVDLSRDDINFRQDYLIIQRGIASDALKTCEIVDAPGISDPDLAKDALRFLSRHADFVIWCTSASQAWRQTEKTAYEKLAKATQEKSVLAITRFDKLRNQKDREKVFKRVQNEAGPYFAKVVGLQTPKANAVKPEDRTDDADGAWVSTGGHAFQLAFENAISTIRKKPKKRNKNVTKQPVDVNVKPATKAKKPSAKMQSKTRTYADLLPALEGLKTIPENGPYCNQIEHLIATIHCETSSKVPDNATLRGYIRIDGDGLDTERLISQLTREIKSFGNGNAIRIDSR